MTVDYNKPLKKRTVIEGVTDETEKRMASEILFNIYNLASDIVNNGGIDKFNSEWKDKHPDWDYHDETRQEEYVKAYESYFKQVADMVANSIGSPYKLKESNPCLIHFEEGWFKISGYKESN